MVNATDINMEPTLPPGLDGNTNIGIASSNTDTASDVNWEFAVFVALWCIGLLLLGAVIFSFLRSRCVFVKARVAEQRDEENQTKENDDTELPITSSPRHENRGRREMSILAAFAVAVALALSVTTQTSCDYVATDNVYVTRVGNDEPLSVTSIGLWSAAIYNGTKGSDDVCQSTFRNGFPVDWKMIFARVVAVVASGVGGLGFISILVSVCSSNMDAVKFRRLSIPIALAVIAQALVNVLRATDLCFSGSSECNLGIAATSSITGSCYWLIAALGLLACGQQQV